MAPPQPRAQRRVGTVYAGLPSGSNPGASKPHAFTLPFHPPILPFLCLLFSLPSSCDSAFPVPVRSFTDQANLFLGPQGNFPLTRRLQTGPELSPTSRSPTPFSSSPSPLHLSHSAFQNVAIEEVAPNTTFLFAFGFRHLRERGGHGEGNPTSVPISGSELCRDMICTCVCLSCF